ncbi:aminotransferase class I/II-fold pyridoxal phosphate-dependent enzyme [Nocardiopsis gilva]|nr:aminotransferase class I/II-fold pyridoxal phosphate-dependent enzyme [Nocardiopsis gilva]
MREEARGLFEADGVPCSALTLTSGALDGIDRVLCSSLRPGDAIALEDPGWPSEYDLTAALGLKRVPMRMDDEGPLPDDLDAALRGGARAVIVTNRAQNPTGAAISAERAAHLRAILAEHPHVLTVEDDHGFGFVELPFQRVGGATERWTLVRSVAKGYGPDLRLAMVTGDPVTVDRVRARQQSGHGWVSQILQEAFVELRRRAAVSAERAGRAYGERRAALIRELERHGLSGRGRSGVNVWVEVPDEARTVAGLLARRWSCTPGRRFRLDSSPGIRVTISALDAQDMATLAADIAAAARPGGPAV